MIIILTLTTNGTINMTMTNSKSGFLIGDIINFLTWNIKDYLKAGRNFLLHEKLSVKSLTATNSFTVRSGPSAGRANNATLWSPWTHLTINLHLPRSETRPVRSWVFFLPVQLWCRWHIGQSRHCRREGDLKQSKKQRPAIKKMLFIHFYRELALYQWPGAFLPL